MRNRASVILVQNHKVGIIKRVREGVTYYVFPGGGIEVGETPEACAKREALEETGLEVKIHECLEKVEFNGAQYFFQAEIIGGTFGACTGEEYTDKKRNRGTYTPMWVDADELLSIDIKPKEVALKVLTLFDRQN